MSDVAYSASQAYLCNFQVFFLVKLQFPNSESGCEPQKNPKRQAQVPFYLFSPKYFPLSLIHARPFQKDASNWNRERPANGTILFDPIFFFFSVVLMRAWAWLVLLLIVTCVQLVLLLFIFEMFSLLELMF